MPEPERTDPPNGPHPADSPRSGDQPDNGAARGLPDARRDLEGDPRDAVDQPGVGPAAPPEPAGDDVVDRHPDAEASAASTAPERSRTPRRAPRRPDPARAVVDDEAGTQIGALPRSRATKRPSFSREGTPLGLSIAAGTIPSATDERVGSVEDRSPTPHGDNAAADEDRHVPSEAPREGASAGLDGGPGSESQLEDTAVALTPAALPEPTTRSAPAAMRSMSTAAPVRRPDPDDAGRSRPPLVERISREMVGVAVLVVLALVCAGLIAAVIHKTNTDAARAAREAASYTPPPLSIPVLPSAAGSTVVVIGNQTVTKAADGVPSTKRWPALLDAAVKGKVSTLASTGAGYTTAGSGGETFAQQASAVPSTAKVVVFFGGLNDANALALDVSKAATTAFSIARKQAPKAKFIVVGPVVGGADSTSDVEILRNALKVSAGIANFTWIDPISRGWVVGAATKQATTLSAADESAISKKLTAAVQAALG